MVESADGSVVYEIQSAVEVDVVSPADETATENYKYRLVDGEIYIDQYIGTGAKDVHLPDTIEGFKVVAISARAFCRNEEIEVERIRR